MIRSGVWVAVLGVIVASLRPAAAQAPAEFYKGKTVTIIVSSAAGGGYDAISRSLARVLPNHLPGAPTVIVQNMPGAGGIVAGNYIYTRAPKDGTAIAQLQQIVAFAPLLGSKEATFDAEKLGWLGSPAHETGVFIVWHTQGVSTLEEARKRELTVGTPGLVSTPGFYARLLRDTLGLTLKLVVGYPGQNDSMLAMERGETDAYTNFYNNLAAFRPHWLSEGKVKVLVQYGPREREAALGAVPHALELARNDEDRALMEAAFAPLVLGRPFAAPPGVPEDRLAALRDAFLATFKDPLFVADVEKGGLKINRPRSGAEIQALIAATYKYPATVVERLRRLQQE